MNKNNQENQPVWRQHGFDKEFMDAVAVNEVKGLSLWWNGPPESADDTELWASWAYSDTNTVFLMGAIGYQMPEPPLSDWRQIGHRLVSAAIYYFFGSWRDKFKYLLIDFDREKARTELPWIDCYRFALCAALALSDWDSADRLLEWPGVDLQYDEGTDDRTEEDLAYYIWLALQLRGDLKDSAQQRDIIESGRRRRPKYLLAAANALFAGDSGTFTSALEKYLRHYRKNEFETDCPDFGICMDGTILWHLARKQGMSVLKLPYELDIFIAKP